MSIAAATRSEFTKFFTTSAWWILGVILLGYLAFIGAGAGFVGGVASGQLGPLLGTASIGALLYGLAGSVGYAFPLIIGVLLVTTEFRHRTLTPTFLATPRRGRSLAAKLLVGLVVGLLAGVVAIVAVALPAAGVLALHDVDPALTSPDTLALFGRLLLAYALWTVVGIGLGALVKNQIVAIVLVIGFTQFVEPMLRVAGTFVDWLDGITRWLPGAASDALVGVSFYSLMAQGAADPLPWWGGAAVLAAWAVLFTVIGASTTWRRDVE